MKRLSNEEYKKVVINILFKIDDICRKHNLEYMIFYGTLLGAVRHKGMIPWDDDVDIVMPRKDFQKLSQILNCNEYPINFIDIDHFPDTIYPQGKVCDKSTVMREKNFKKVKDYGAFVDVFPLDYAPNDYKKRMKEKKYLRRLILLETHCSRTGFEKSDSIKTNFLRLIAFLLSRLITPQFLLRKINDYVTEKSNTKTDYYRVFGGGIFPVKWLSERSEIEFEGRNLFAPRNTDIVLQACFGDYMELPPEEERVNKHSFECYKK